MSEMSGVDWLPSFPQNNLPHNPLGPLPCYAYGEDNYYNTPAPGTTVENVQQEITPGNTLNKSKEGKPPYSYASLIRLAISNCPKGKMTLSEIYQFIIQTFPYYKEAGTGWKNSIRHNLSLNKCFTKVARSKDDPGKGSYWAIDYNYSQDEAFIKKKKGHMFRSSPYSPECSSNSSDYSGGGPNSRIGNRAVESTISRIATVAVESQEKEISELCEEEITRERCAGPRHKCYTDEYGNYIDQYNEECDHTCLPYSSLNASNLQAQTAGNNPGYNDVYCERGSLYPTESGADCNYGSYSSSSDLCSPVCTDMKFFDFPHQYVNEDYQYDPSYTGYSETDLKYDPNYYNVHHQYAYRTDCSPPPSSGVNNEFDAMAMRKISLETDKPWNDCL